jgi:hypothetical protein
MRLRDLEVAGGGPGLVGRRMETTLGGLQRTGSSGGEAAKEQIVGGVAAAAAAAADKDTDVAAAAVAASNSAAARTAGYRAASTGAELEHTAAAAADA